MARGPEIKPGDTSMGLVASVKFRSWTNALVTRVRVGQHLFWRNVRGSGDVIVLYVSQKHVTVLAWDLDGETYIVCDVPHAYWTVNVVKGRPTPTGLVKIEPSLKELKRVNRRSHTHR